MKATKLRSDSCLIRPVSRGKEKDPGSAFAWPGGGWLRTPLPWHSPDLISLPVRLASPVLD